jgi:hypothetical protein
MSKKQAAPKDPNKLAAMGCLTLLLLGIMAVVISQFNVKPAPVRSAELAASDRAVELGERDGRDAAKTLNAENRPRTGAEIIEASSAAADSRKLTGEERLKFMVAFTNGFKAVRK